MINLNSTSEVLQLITGSTNSTHVTVDYIDLTTSGASIPSGINDQIIAAATTTTIAAAPAASTQRKIYGIRIHNSGGTNQTVTIQRFNGTTGFTIFFCDNLQANYTLVFDDSTGWTLFNDAGSVQTALNGITSFSAGTTGLTPSSPVSGGAITLAGTLVVGAGGTGITTVPTNGQLLIGNGTNYTVASLSSGTGISTTVGAGTLQINNTGVTSAVAGSNISVSAASGAVTIAVTGTIPSATTSTNIAGGAAGSIPFQTAANTTSLLATASGVLIGGSTPSYSTTPTLIGTNFTNIPNSALSNDNITVTGGTGLGVSGSPVVLGGTVTLSNTGVTSIAGTANEIVASASTGAVTLSFSQPEQCIVAASSAINTTETYLKGITIGTGVAAGDIYEILIFGTCTSTAANLSTFTVRCGTAGTTADGTVNTVTCTAATSGTTVGFYVRIIVTFRTVGSSGTALANGMIINTGVTGISSTTNTVSTNSTAATVNTTNNNILGVSYKSAATTTTSTFQTIVVSKIR